MICCQQIERVGPQLESLSPLVECYRRGEFDFPDRALRWLDETEKLLAGLRVPGSTEIVTLKGRILKAADSLAADEGKPARSRVRSARNAAAMSALERAEEILRDCRAQAEDRLDQFEGKLCEGLTALSLQVPLPDRYEPATAWLTEIWTIMAQTPPTRPLATYLAASLSMVDRLFLLDTVLSRLESLPPRA